MPHISPSHSLSCCRCIAPGHAAVLHGVVPAVVHQSRHRLVEVADAAVTDGDARDGGEHALRRRVGGIDECRVAELRDDVALVDHEAVGARAAGRHRPEQRPEDALLVREVHLPCRLLPLRERDRSGQGDRVEPERVGGTLLPRPGRWDVGRLRVCAGVEEQAGDRQGSRGDSSEGVARHHAEILRRSRRANPSRGIQQRAHGAAPWDCRNAADAPSTPRAGIHRPRALLRS